jgi:ribonucleoside-diphosphate reductase alpha chain
MRPNLKSPDKFIPEAFLQLDKAFLAGVLDGLFSTDGSVLMKQDNPMLRFHTASHELAQQVRLVLLQFGIHSRVYTATREENLEYDGRSMYGTGIKYDVIVMNEGLARFYAEIGLSHPEKAARLKEVAENWHFIGGTWTASVISVQDTEREEEVYDIYEPNTLTWITNGYVSFDCGEQGLPAWGVCNLGALNLAKFVKPGPTGETEVDWDNLRLGVRYAIRFLDNVIDATPYFFEQNEKQQLSERRVGMGTMGLAEMMVRLNIRYGGPESVEFLDRLYGFIAAEAYLASADYAAEKGAFPMFEADQFLQSGFMQGMPERVRSAVRQQGIRNVTLLTQAPTGTTGTMVNTSTGIEPFYFWSFHRKGRMGTHEERVNVYEEWLQAHPNQPLPDYFVTAMDLSPEDHVRVQAAIQRWVDSSISKTCNTPHNYTVAQTRELYELMYELGCKGGTIYRDGSRDVQVLNLKDEDKEPEKTEAKAKIEEIKWRARPAVLHGRTYKKNTPIGTAYITVNANGEGDEHPFEVFINVGKAGSDVAADAEGVGRLVSLILRMPSPLSPQERVADIVAQLRGIGSGRQQGFGKNRVMSMPDAVAQALAEHVGIDAGGDLPGLPDEGDAIQSARARPKGDLCPGCGSASLIFIEGCKKCHECGYSEC